MTLTAPHDLIDLDDKALLDQTADAYAAFAARLSGKGSEPHSARGIKALRRSFRTLKAIMAAMENQEDQDPEQRRAGLLRRDLAVPGEWRPGALASVRRPGRAGDASNT